MTTKPLLRSIRYLLASFLTIAFISSPVYADTSSNGVRNHSESSSVNLMGGNPVSTVPVPVLPVLPDEVVNQTFDVPVIVIHAKYVYPTPKLAAHPSFIPVRLPQWPEMYGNLAEYELLLGNSRFYILAPRGMKATADVGQDGSYNVSLSRSGMEVDLMSTGACGMCAVNAAGEYFPAVRPYVKSIEGAWRGVSIEKLPVTQFLWNAKTDLFAYKEKDNQTLAGFAYYTQATKQSSGSFISEVIRGDRNHVNALAPWIFRATLRQVRGSGVDSPPSGLVLYHGPSKMVQQIRAAEQHLHLNAEYWPILGTKDEAFDSAYAHGHVLVLKFRDVIMMDSPVPFSNQTVGTPIVLQNGAVANWISRGKGGEIDTNFNGVYMRLVSTRLSPHQLMDVAATLDPLDG